MKKVLIFMLVAVFVLVLAVGCAQSPASSSESSSEASESSESSESSEASSEKEIGKVTDVGYIDLTPEEAKMLIESTPDLVVVDVSPKYDEGHLPGAINFYIGDGSLDAALPDLDMGVPYLVYCHVDAASIPGATKFVEAGFDPVYRLEGNYAAWVDAGYEIEK